MPGMNWAIPWAPAGETANGLKFDSAISWAASRPAETFQRAAARRIGARKRGRDEAREARPPAAPAVRRPRARPEPSAAGEQGAGPRS